MKKLLSLSLLIAALAVAVGCEEKKTTAPAGKGTPPPATTTTPAK